MTQYTVASLAAVAGLTHSGVRAFLSRPHFGRILTRVRGIGKINGCLVRGSRIEVRDDSRGREGEREREREMKKNERALLKSLECGVMRGRRSSAIRHNISSPHINSKIAIVRERYIYIFFFSLP